MFELQIKIKLIVELKVSISPISVEQAKIEFETKDEAVVFGNAIDSYITVLNTDGKNIIINSLIKTSYLIYYSSFVFTTSLWRLIFNLHKTIIFS